MQGYNARKVISEVCAFFVLQCVLSLGGNLMLLTSSDTKRTLMHLFLFANSGQRELVSICTQSIHGRNKLSLHYILDFPHTPPLLSFLSLLLQKKLFSKKTPNLTWNYKQKQ